jgi:formamidopyrimidine-DNA glycosylase
MPELPEVEIVKRALDDALIGRVIRFVDQRREGLRFPFPENIAARLEGAKILQSRRRAKYILIDLDSNEILVLHLGMSGKVLIIDNSNDYQPQKHDHLILSLDDGAALVFNDTRRFGMVLLLSDEDYSSHSAFKDLGPEPLDNSFSAPVLLDALKNKKANIKTALLDQKVVAGLGNIYVCEALFMTGISPDTKACDLNEGQIEDLVIAIRDVLNRALEAGGSSLRDYRHADGDIGYFQRQLAVYGREGKECLDCSCDIMETGGVKRISQAGRSTFFCPSKQSLGKREADIS